MKLRDKLSSYRSPLKEVDIPEIDDVVYIRKMTVQESMDYQTELFGGKIADVNEIKQSMTLETAKKSLFLLIALTLCSKDGNRLYSNSEEDLVEIGKIESDILTKIAEESKTYNKLNGADEVKTEIKN